MKRFFLLLAVPFACWACTDADARYVDLNTGKTVKLEKNEAGIMVNAETKKPVAIYVDTKANDTIYGKTGEVINGHVVMTGENTWSYDAALDGDASYKVTEGDYKMKVDKDGDIKIKNGDTKTKVDGETGEKKTKKD